MAYKRIKVSDETENTYGVSVLTSGISLTRFKKNPVMFFSHNTYQPPIGLWKDLRIENTSLSAEPVFDEEDDAAMKLAGKYERGFLKGASIGIRVKEIQRIEDPSGKKPTRRIITKSELMEISLTGNPSNTNALQLYASSGEPIQANDQAAFSAALDAHIQIDNEPMSTTTEQTKLLQGFKNLLAKFSSDPAPEGGDPAGDTGAAPAGAEGQKPAGDAPAGDAPETLTLAAVKQMISDAVAPIELQLTAATQERDAAKAEAVAAKALNAEAESQMKLAVEEITRLTKEPAAPSAAGTGGGDASDGGDELKLTAADKAARKLFDNRNRK